MSLLQGCSSGGKPTYTQPAQIGKQILALENGASIDEVKAEIGRPESEFSEGDRRTTLNYAGWQLVFEHDQLVVRIHEVQRIAGVPRGGPSGGKLLKLRLGMSLPEVVHRLGKPDVVEVEYRSREQPERILRYGPWEFRFRGGVLRFRAQS